MSNGSADDTYHYDHIGNVQMVTYSSGYKAFFFSQDAYGNELSLAGTAYTGSAWSTARSAGVHEHQTGKTLDPLTGLYYFHARWYDSGVGRFVGDEKPIRSFRFNMNEPTGRFDSDGKASVELCNRHFDGDQMTDHPYASYFHGHCYLRLTDDSGNVHACQVNETNGLVIPDHDPYMRSPFHGCKEISYVKYDCIVRALKRLMGYYESGIIPPGFGPRNIITNNCCSAVNRVIDACTNIDLIPPIGPGGLPSILPNPRPGPRIPPVPGGRDSENLSCLN